RNDRPEGEDATLTVKRKDFQKGVVENNGRTELKTMVGDKTHAASGTGRSSELEGVRVGEVLLQMGDGKEKEQGVKQVTEVAAKPSEEVVTVTAIATGVYM
ncbi:hypothetical protein A2U01_0071927, partial [Trifolium medium]|nr:hypothetical protein [Trifolium medium]